MYREFVRELVKNSSRGFGTTLKTEKYKDIFRHIISETQYFYTSTFSEKVFVYINELKEKPRCLQCGIKDCNYKNILKGYFECCGYLCANKRIALQRKEKDPNTFTKSR